MLKQVEHFCERFSEWAPVIIRVALGVVFIMHGAQKLFGAFGGPGIEGVVGFVGSLGFTPALFWAWTLALVEFIGGVLLVAGVFVRSIAFLIAIDMIVAWMMVHGSKGFFVGSGGYEFVFVLLAMSLAVMLHGSDKMSVSKLFKAMQ